MIRLFKSTATAIRSAAIALIIVAGVISAAAHLAVPLLGGFRDDVEQWLESALRAPVRIERLAVRWRSQGPELVAHNVAVLDLAGYPTVELRELAIALGLGDLLREWRLRPWRVGINGVRLKVVRKADGSLGIQGIRPFETEIDTAPDSSASSAAALLLLLPERLRITDAEVSLEDQMRGRPPLAFPHASLMLHNEGTRHQINASVELPNAQGARLAVAAELTADPDRLDDWQADLFLDLQGAELAPLLDQLVPPHYRFEGVRTDLRVWSHWRGGEPTWIEGRAAVHDAVISGVETGRGLRLDAAGGRFRWDRREDGWLLRVADFGLDRPNRAPLSSEWALAWRRGGRDSQPGLHLVGDRLALDDLATLLAVRPPGGQPVADLLAADPRGTLRSFDIQAVQRRTNGWWWSAAGEVTGGELNAQGNLPGVDNVDLQFAASADGGRASLATTAARLALPRLFPDSLPLEALRAEVQWQALPDGGWAIEAPGVELANADIRARSRLRLELPPDGRAVIDLRATLRDLPAERALAYLPVNAMDQKLVTWLNSAIQGGRITGGTCTLRGPLADFPFEAAPTGEFEVRLAIEAAGLDFAPGWPGLREMDGEVLVHGYTVDVQVDRARLYDSLVTEAHARIEAPPGSPVEIKGAVRGPIADPLRLLRESPLSLDFGDIAQQLEGTGEVGLRLDFAVPFNGSAKARLEGEVAFTGNELGVVGTAVRATALEGRLAFDLDGLKAKGIRGRLLGAPALIDVQTQKTGSTRLTANLRGLDAPVLGELAQDVAWPVRGAATVTATLDVPPLHSGERLLIRVESDLKGVAVDMPAPLGKSANSGRPIAIELGIPGRGPLGLKARYGGEVDLAVELDADTTQPLRGALTLGGGHTEVPKADRYVLRGRVPELDVSAWMDWWRSQGGDAADRRHLRPLVDVELGAERLLLGDGALDDVRLAIRETPGAWQGDIRATTVEGTFRYPVQSERGPASLSLERLDLRSDPTEPSTKPAPARTAIQDPRELPEMVVDIRQLRINGHDFGRAHAIAGRVEQGLQLKDLSIDGPAGRLNGGGTWVMRGEGPRTSLNFALDTPDFGHLILALGFADTIERGPAKLNGEVSWPGAPLEASRDKVSGRLDLAMGEGQFLDVDPGIGRVMGLLNVTAIQRRLTLDFSDLFKKGLGFDGVTGHFDLNAGVVQTNDLTIKGPSGLIEISGRTDVISQEFDQTVTVTPSLRSTLPIAGAVVGGPVVGAAMLVLQGLIGKQVDQIGAVRYAVTGPWAEPEVTVLAGKTLLERLRGASAETDAAAAPRQSPAPVEGQPGDSPPQQATPPAEKPRSPVPALH